MPAAVGAGGQRGGRPVLPAQPQGGHTGGSSRGGYTREEVARVASAAVASDCLIDCKCRPLISFPMQVRLILDKCLLFLAAKAAL